MTRKGGAPSKKQATAKGGADADVSASGVHAPLRRLVPLAAITAGIAVASALYAGAGAGRPAGRRSREEARPSNPSSKEEAARGVPAWNSPSEVSESYLAEVAKSSGVNMDLQETELPGAEPEPKVLSQSPRIYLFESLLSPVECEFLKGLVAGRLKPAGVVTQVEDKHTVQTQSRNNEQTWLTPQQERSIPMLRHILKRLHRVAHIPDTDAEALQIGRYGPGNKYESHLDSDPAHDVERPATLLVYLNDVESGGDTLFPLEKRAQCSTRWHAMPDGSRTFGCARCCDSDMAGTIRVRPKLGNAILFFSHHMDGKRDPLSEHAACPVREGEKWIAQRWFRLKPYQNIRFPPDPRFDGFPAVPSDRPWDGRIRVLSRQAPRAYLLENFLSAEENMPFRHAVQCLLRAPADIAAAISAALDGLSGCTRFPLRAPISSNGLPSLRAEECAHLVGLAGTLGPPSTSGGVERWSVGEGTERGDLAVAAIAKRLHRAARIPETHGELLELAHHPADLSLPVQHGATANTRRVATVLLSLSAAHGGDLIFPTGRCSSAEDCCRSGEALRVPLHRGSAVLLYLRTTGGKARDKLAAHGACAARSGSHWTASRHFHTKPLRGLVHAADPKHDLEPLLK